MKAYQIMTTDLITVRPDTTLKEIARLLTTHRIGSVPVVDEDDQLVGIVSKDDLFPEEKCVPFSTLRLPALFNQWIDKGRLSDAYKTACSRTASDVMKAPAACVDAWDDIEDVAELMALRKLACVPVLCSGRLAGMVSRSDLIRVLTKAG